MVCEGSISQERGPSKPTEISTSIFHIDIQEQASATALGNIFEAPNYMFQTDILNQVLQAM
jgi:hypothetical protein